MSGRDFITSPAPLSRVPELVTAETTPRHPSRTRLLGREFELAAVTRLLIDPTVPLLTLTGPAGVGKSRLARAVCAEQEPLGGRRVVTVDLAETDRPDVAWHEIAVALTPAVARTGAWERLATPRAGASRKECAPADATALASPHAQVNELAEELAEQLAADADGPTVLLLLDNCDLVAAALSLDLAALIHRCPRLRVLVTSRTSLDVSAERLFPLEPLTAGPLTADTRVVEPLTAESLTAEPLTVESLTAGARATRPVPAWAGTGPEATVSRGAPAVELFLGHVQAYYRNQVLHGADLEAIAQICAELDGVPLAIEVTAGAVGTLSPRTLLARLRGGEHPYRTRPLDVANRHRSLSAALAWGEGALSAEEQSLIQRLAVCESPVDVAVAERVGGLSWWRAARVMDGLVHKSLLLSVDRQSESDGEPEFRMLRTTRNHYRTQLAADPARLAETHARHLAHYAAFAREAAEGLANEAERGRWLDAVGGRLADLRLAVRTAQDRGEHDTAVRLLLGLEDAWVAHGVLAGMAALLDRTIDAVQAAPADATSPLAPALEGAGRWAELSAQTAAARTALRQAETVYRSSGDRFGVARVTGQLSELARRAGDLPGAASLAADAVAAYEAVGDRTGAAAARRTQALVAAALGAPDAEAPLRRALDDLAGLDSWHAMGVRAALRLDLVRVRRMAGRPVDARTAALEALGGLPAPDSSPGGVAALLEVAALSASTEQEDERLAAARMLFAARVLRERHGLPLGEDEEELRALEARLAETLPDGALARLRLRAPGVSPRAALDEAREALAPPPGPPPEVDPTLRELTPRQQQIALLVAEGLTNRQVARQLDISEWTVVNHLRQVMRKLGCPSRVHVARVIQSSAGTAAAQ
ncbi:ATP-binding protein [Streptomyces profundus]|uniref:ATP-binding protein n=1 Tax=Streptomyces profundus TaxID=2867410 RepID=UPI001D168F17|nr:LuxR C-terminal-related transcriptional regulator [Streptomyces sp. MA3_2.13]UED85453.1 LuxR C-terminal-related transcriptional regulator [Streptomyces sp. MA3_2.13]